MDCPCDLHVQSNHVTESIITADPEGERRQRLENIINKYTQDWPVHHPQVADVECSGSEVILLTGSTGGLGSQILAQLVAVPSVTQIYAFNRPPQRSLYGRHLEAFTDRGNDISLLKSDKIVYVEGDTSEAGFKLNLKLFNEVCSQ